QQRRRRAARDRSRGGRHATSIRAISEHRERNRAAASMSAARTTVMGNSDSALSLYRLLDPAVVVDPYPLYRRLQTEDPVHWDPYLHAWVVTRYADVLTVLQRCSAQRQPSPEQLTALGLSELNPV